jgi:hypothetical protein
MRGQPDALSALQAAQKDRQALARKEAAESPQAEIPDLGVEEAVVQLCVAMYAHGCTFGMGALPDGTGIYGRVRIPGKSSHPCAGMVAFVVSDDPGAVLLKALSALESSPKSRFWKPDQFAEK